MVVEIKWFTFVTRSCETTRSKDHITFRVEVPQGKSTSYQVLWAQTLYQWRYNGFSLPCDLVRLYPPLTISSKEHVRTYKIQELKYSLDENICQCVNDINLILVTPFCLMNDKIHAKKSSSIQKQQQEGKNEKRKAIALLFAFAFIILYFNVSWKFIS